MLTQWIIHKKEWKQQHFWLILMFNFSFLRKLGWGWEEMKRSVPPLHHLDTAWSPSPAPPGWWTDCHFQRLSFITMLYDFLSILTLIRTCSSVFDTSLTKYPLLLSLPPTPKLQEQIHRLLVSWPFSWSTWPLQFSPWFASDPWWLQCPLQLSPKLHHG